MRMHAFAKEDVPNMKASPLSCERKRMFRIYTNILFVWNQLKERMNRFKEILPPHTEKERNSPSVDCTWYYVIKYTYH